MNSATLPSFWTAYRTLDEAIKRSARKAYRLWAENPFHPSLRFKCINQEENIWAVRITVGTEQLAYLRETRSHGFGLGTTMIMSSSFRREGG